MKGGDRDVRHLIAQARAGTDGALADLLQGYRNYLAFLARRGLDEALRPKADASDVVQETLVLAFERFAQFNGTTEGELTNWLRQILARTLAKLVRRYRRTEARALDRERSLEQLLHESSFALGRVVLARGPSPSEGAQAHERSVALANALAQLPEDYRQVVVLRSLRQRSWDAIGAEVGRSPAAARMLWTRALKALGGLIEESQI